MKKLEGNCLHCVTSAVVLFHLLILSVPREVIGKVKEKLCNSEVPESKASVMLSL